MSLREDLDLDISEAQRRITRIEDQLGQAARSFGNTLQAQLDRVQGLEVAVDLHADTAELTAQVDAAVDQATTDVTVTADTRDVTASIDRATDAADTAVTVQGDAGNLTASIDQAVDAADSFVIVDADASGARSEVDSVTSRVEVLRSVLLRTVGLLAGGALVTSFVRVGAEYNQLVQTSLAAYTTILGTTRDATALLDQIAEFARTSPFPRQAFIEATQTLLSFGFAADEVVPTLSAIQDTVAAIGGDAIEIREITRILAVVNSTGKITAETLNQLGLRGVNAAKLIAGQMGTTEAAIRTSITNGTLDAREALDLLLVGMQEQFEGAAEGVKQTFAGATDSVKAAIRDISSALMAGFVAPQGGGLAVEFANEISRLLRIVEAEVAGELGQSLSDLAGSFIPALINALQALLPLLTTGSQILVALTPIIQVVGAALSAIPSEVITLIAAWRIANTVSGVFAGGLDRVAVGLFNMAGGFDRAVAGGVTLNPVMVGLTAAVAAYTLISARNAARERERAAAVQNVRTAMQESIPTVEAYGNAVQEATGDNSRLVEALRSMGLTVDEFAQQVADGTMSVAALNEEIDRLYQERLPANMPDDFNLYDNQAEVERLRALKAQAQAIEELAAAELDAGVARGEWTERAREAAIEATRNADGTANLAAAYARLRDELLTTGTATSRANASLEALGINIDRVRRLTEAAADAYDDFVGAASGALLTSSSAFQVAADAGTRYERSTARSRSTTERFTRSLQDARRALEEALQPASDRDLERSELRHERALNAREDAAQKVLDAERAVANAAVEAARTGESLTVVRARLERELRDARLSAREAVIAEADAQDALTATRQQGTDVDERVIAAKERLAQVSQDAADAQLEAAEKSLEAARKDQEAGRVREVTADELTRRLQETAERIAQFRTDIATIADAGFTEAAATLAREGPELAGKVATEIASAIDAGDTSLAEGVDQWAGTLRTENDALIALYEDELGPAFVAAILAGSEDATDAFGDGLDFATPVQVAAALAFTKLDEEGQEIALLAGRVGEAAARKLAEDFDLSPEDVDLAVQVGRDLMGGVGVGIEESQALVIQKVTDAANRILDPIRNILQIQSPSRVTMGLGRNIMQGLAIGIEAEEDAVVRAAEGVVQQAWAAIRDAEPPQVEALPAFTTRTPPAGSPAALPGPGGTSAAGLVINGDVTLNAYGVDASTAQRHAFQELESLGRRGRS